MPVGFPVPRRQSNPSSGTTFSVGGVPVPSSANLSKGSAVAIVDLLGDGNLCYCPCSAKVSDHGLHFFGFLQEAVESGSTPTVIFSRGAIFEPQVEDGAVLVVGQPVFLSLTLGKVTQAAVQDTGAVSLCVGYAVSETSIVFLTDNRFLL